MSAVEYGYCAHCDGRFIRTVNDEPNRAWCGGCRDGEPKTAPVKKNYGYARKALVPDRMGTPKVCGKCSLWFAAVPRQRTCQGCARNDHKAKFPRNDGSGIAPRRTLVSGGVSPGERVVKNGFVEMFSDYLNLTFRCPVNDPMAASLECRVLAYEEAARQRWEMAA